MDNNIVVSSFHFIILLKFFDCLSRKVLLGLQGSQTFLIYKYGSSHYILFIAKSGIIVGVQEDDGHSCQNIIPRVVFSGP